MTVVTEFKGQIYGNVPGFFKAEQTWLCVSKTVSYPRQCFYDQVLYSRSPNTYGRFHELGKAYPKKLSPLSLSPPLSGRYCLIRTQPGSRCTRRVSNI